MEKKIQIEKNNKEWVELWIIGFTEGAGSFSVLKSNGKWSLTFKITQSKYNARAIYYIKDKLKVGTVKLEKNTNKISYRLCNFEHIHNILLPIFDKYGLLTTKEISYLKFKKSCNILRDKLLTVHEKEESLLKILQEQINKDDYKAKIWQKGEDEPIKKPWLIGFIEADGSYYIVKKDANRYVHGFCITQKYDGHFLECIRKLLHIPSNIQYKKRYNSFSLDTTNSRAIENIIKYSEGELKGMKAVACRIWSRTYRKHKGNPEILKEIQEKIRKMNERLKV